MGVRGAFAICGAAVALLTACSGAVPSEPSPDLATPTSTLQPSGSGISASPTQLAQTPLPGQPQGDVTPSATPSVAAVQAHTGAGADAFIRFYLQRVNAAWALPDATLLNGLSNEKCGTCDNLRKTAARLTSDRQRYVGDAVELQESVQLPESSPPDKIAVQGVIVQLPARVVDADSKTVRTAKRTANLGSLTAVWSSKGWQMEEIRFEAQAR